MHLDLISPGGGKLNVLAIDVEPQDTRSILPLHLFHLRSSARMEPMLREVCFLCCYHTCKMDVLEESAAVGGKRGSPVSLFSTYLLPIKLTRADGPQTCILAIVILRQVLRWDSLSFPFRDMWTKSPKVLRICRQELSPARYGLITWKKPFGNILYRFHARETAAGTATLDSRVQLVAADANFTLVSKRTQNVPREASHRWHVQ